MVFTRDWSTSTPIDHTLNASWPDYDRRAKVDVGDRLATIISGFASGETALGVLNLPFIAVSAPSAVTDQIQLYGKVVSTKTELHAKDEDGTEIQLTNAGKINGAAIGGAIPALSLAALYPVGVIYTSVVSTNPNSLFGFGTWVAFGSGRVLVGLDGGQTEFDTVEETGGAKTHTLTVDEMPAHTHTYTRPPTGAGSSPGSGSTQDAPSATTGSTGGGTAHNNLQPYIVVYFFKRTA